LTRHQLAFDRGKKLPTDAFTPMRRINEHAIELGELVSCQYERRETYRNHVELG
jgi:hypothetical protein